MKIKRIRKNEKQFKEKTKVTVMLLLASTLLAGPSFMMKDLYQKYETIGIGDNEKNKNDNSSIQYISIFTETDNTLFKYNSWLQKLGSEKKLTIEDLEWIERNVNNRHPNDGIISIKLQDGDYGQVGKDYLVIVNEENNIELICDTATTSTDLLKGIPRVQKEFTVIDTVEDFICKNNIETIGYTTQKWPAWDDQDSEFIKKSYGEDVLYCLEENGYPLPCYDANDLYKSYYEQLFNIENLKL